MKLIGMLDSPYVRRTAISLRCMGIEFEHEAVSVFNHFARFQQFNPVVKAPTLVFAEGDVLLDSTLIIQYAESLVNDEKKLMPRDTVAFKNALQTISVALAACEKAVQLIYEKNLRPAEKQFAPWQERVAGQLLAACALLENRLANSSEQQAHLTQPFITAAVAWQFIQSMLGDLLIAHQYPRLTALSSHAETLPEFLAYPATGPGVALPRN